MSVTDLGEMLLPVLLVIFHFRLLGAIILIRGCDAGRLHYKQSDLSVYGNGFLFIILLWNLRDEEEVAIF